MLLSAVSVLVVAQSSSEIPEGLMNNSVYGEKRGAYRGLVGKPEGKDHSRNLGVDVGIIL